MEENISGALEELAQEVGDASGPLGACCDVIGGRDKSAVGVFCGVLRQGGTRILAARPFGSIPFGSDACRTQVNVSSDELSTSLLKAHEFVHRKMS